MIEVRQTAIFTKWLAELRDQSARSRILLRVRRLEQGNSGDVKPVGEGVSEMRIAYGPGYRVYFLNKGQAIIILLCGGDKRTQNEDIAKAKELAKEA